MKKKGVLSLLFIMIFLSGLTAGCKGKVDNVLPWDKMDNVLSSIKDPVFRENTFNIMDFGAVVNNPELLNTKAIEKAIEACHKAGGGVVLIPNGTFYTGSIELKSNVNLHLSDSSVLKFSINPQDYFPFVITRWEGWDCINFKPLIYAYKQTNIAITGNGILDGQANETNWWPWKGKEEYGWEKGMISQEWNHNQVSGRDRLEAMEQKNVPVEKRLMKVEDRLRPPFIQPYLCQNVLIQDVKIINAPFWLVHPLVSENVIVRNVTMNSHGPNNDGCDPESCKNVLIEGCYFNTGDDCIAIKSGRNNDGRRWGKPSENIIIRNCIMKDGHGGIVVGSEISGGCYNVWAENCEMDSPELERVVRIKSNAIRGGNIENIYVRNIRVGECKEAVFRVEMKYENVKEGPNIPSVKNIILENITCNKSKYGIYIDGLENSVQVRNVLVRNCTFNNVKIEKKIVGAENITLENVRINELVELLEK